MSDSDDEEKSDSSDSDEDDETSGSTESDDEVEAPESPWQLAENARNEHIFFLQPLRFVISSGR